VVGIPGFVEQTQKTTLVLLLAAGQIERVLKASGAEVASRVFGLVLASFSLG
jgi:small neutral amino acid transporter SnatA (MarC family)